KSLEDKIAFRADHLTKYQSKRLAKRYRKRVDAIEDTALREAVAKGYHKLLAYKDEYEVARLLLGSRAKAETEFAGDLKLTYHLAPPLLSRSGTDGRPKKRAFGQGMGRLFPLLAHLKMLRGTPLDVFGYTAERRMERRLIKRYEADLARLEGAADRDAALELARLPLQIRGFGPVKERAAAAADARRKELLEQLKETPPSMQHAAE
ncbi:MAG: DUF6537 domain-containing protein, partial [Planctomycetota bacterium]